MFIPIGDTPNPRNFTPWVTWGLIAVNVGVYLLITLPFSAQTPAPSDPLLQEYLRVVIGRLPSNVPVEALIGSIDGWDLMVYAHGYKPGAASIDDLFSSMFMHAGFMHLAGNMLFLWIYGDNVEHHVGRFTFLVGYLGTGAIATLSFGAAAGDSLIPLVGASGAISGVLGAYFLLFPRNQVKVFVFLFPFIMTAMLVPARIVLGIYIIVSNVFPALLGEGSSVAYGAHIGGFVAGLVLAWGGEKIHWSLGGAKARLDMPRRSATPPPKFVTIQDAGSALALAVRRGERIDAVKQARLLHPGLILDELGGDAVLLAEWLAEADEPILAMTILRRAMSLPRDQIDQARVFLTLGLVRLRQGQPTAAYQHILAVFDHDPDPDTEARARQALRQIRPMS